MDAKTVCELRSLLETDPGLPTESTPPSFWMLPEHPIASTQSATLPSKTDVAVLGAGLTGTAAVNHLLETANKETTITVLEARTICSGATGRNGGNLLSPGPLLYSTVKRAYGTELAHKFVDFTHRVVKTTKEAMESIAPEESEIREIARVFAYRDEERFQIAKESVLEYEASRPDSKGLHTIFEGEEALQKFNARGLAGAIQIRGYAAWPYRFITKLWAIMLEEYSSRLNLETTTPVTKILFDPNPAHPSHPYILTTPRGIIRASKVMHCTNAYSPHLIPGLRGKLYPYRETMTVQDFKAGRGELRSWGIIQKPRTDPTTGAMTSGLLYVQQNLNSGLYFIGGGLNTVPEIVSTDDSLTDPKVAEYLQSELSSFLGASRWTGQLVSTWSGVQGMTSDSAPLVGKLPKELSGRDGDEEWIAAGFNGGGMCMCWLAAEALVKMASGKPVPEWLPDFFLLSEDRVATGLTVERSVEAMAPFWR